MTTPANEKRPRTPRRAAITDDTPPAQPRERRPFSIGLALIFSIIAMLVSIYLWYYLIEERKELYARKTSTRLVQLEEQVATLKNAGAKAATDLAHLRDMQDATQLTLNNLQRDASRARREWLIGEAEQLLTIANHRLQLARDPGRALAALRAADRQLAALADPLLVPVRRQLAGEIQSLEALERRDLPGMSLKLGRLAAQIDRLPFAVRPPRAHEPATEPAATGGFWENLKSDLGQLIRIRRHGEVRAPLLLPEQQYYLRENLRLMLYSAQSALLNAEPAVADQSLRAARVWLNDHFDRAAPMVRNTDAELETLIKARLGDDLPAIGAALRQLRDLGGSRAAP
jgi:uncharacterized protein HemX